MTKEWMEEMKMIRGTHLYKMERKWGEGRPHWERWEQYKSEIEVQHSESSGSTRTGPRAPSSSWEAVPRHRQRFMERY